MTHDHGPGADDARDALDRIAQSRRAAALATRRPVWTDAGLSLTVGAAIALSLLGWWGGALAVLVVGSLAFTLAQRLGSRRRGQVLDQRTLGARAWRFGLLYAALSLALVDVPAGWHPWAALAVGAAAALGGFAWLRWDDRYQTRRLADGDYERYDLL